MDDNLITEPNPNPKPRNYLSKSSVDTWLRCKYLYFLKYVMQIERIDAQLSDPIKMGSLWDMLQEKEHDKSITYDNVKGLIDKLEIGDVPLAKVRAAFRAYKKIIEPMAGKCTCQHNVTKEIAPGIFVNGIFDRKYKPLFVETKFTSNRKYYDNVFSLTPQVATYFMLELEVDRVIMEITTSPQLRRESKKKIDEPVEGFENRIYNDILDRPAHYFIGYNEKTGTFGIRFGRSEFDLELIRRRYISVWKEMEMLRKKPIHKDNNIWNYYMSECNCFMYGQKCEFKDVCVTGEISGNVYRYKDKSKK